MAAEANSTDEGTTEESDERIPYEVMKAIILNGIPPGTTTRDGEERIKRQVAAYYAALVGHTFYVDMSPLVGRLSLICFEIRNFLCTLLHSMRWKKLE